LRKSSPPGENSSWSLGVLSSRLKPDARATAVRVSDDELTVTLNDGRTVSTPLAWFPRLLHATPDERQNWEILGDGIGVHWPDVDEDLSIAGLLRGMPGR